VRGCARPGTLLDSGPRIVLPSTQTHRPKVNSMNSHSSIADKRRAFRRLHEAGCFVIPNPWDIGSAKFLQGLGFKALATTSSGFAWSQGRRDGQISRDQALAHFEALVAATDVPINADFESGFAADPSGVSESVSLALQTGIAAVSIEDSTGDSAKPLRDIGQAVERMRAARDAIDRAGGDALLVGRAECFLVGKPDLEETIRRLRAYSNAGADCLYAPGLRQPDQIRAVVEAVAPKPVNLLVGSAIGLTLHEIAQLGVRRVSVGGALARCAWAAFMRTARLIAAEGRFDGFADAVPHQDLDSSFPAA
jgi:2-methylisocitrate lyase-like PEP mutase family enzyme